ncbi:hypothetical protein Patl1_20821 [Pistacia atlantica]|uniref:Uncharacterized protein n=1 Tax=Pistacia atlantica TaxID=434234 RepID=A0ACC1BKL3_9ROSI|nr:hypothetical protein Patl1_20821 [Pistacia atlantica]
MEALIPEPSPSNIRKFKKGMWRKTTPEGLKLKKYIEGPDGTLIQIDLMLEKMLGLMIQSLHRKMGKSVCYILMKKVRYHTKLPCTYFLDKLDSSEVDIPLDPFLFKIISSSGVESVMLLHFTSSHFLYKKYNQLFDMAYAEIFILPVGDVGETKSMYKEVGVPLSGPPGTGKTLSARTLAKESGLPFVFASGAEFTDSEKSGAARINEMFSIARRNAPAFIFVDEIDAIAGRHARKDPGRRATFEALIAQLDGDKEKTGVDWFSLRQALIFICATNRPDELDLEFVCPGPCLPYCWFFWGRYNLVNEAAIMSFVSVLLTVPSDTNPKYYVVISCAFSSDHLKSCPGWWLQVRKGHSKIYKQDIVDVLDKQLLEGMGVCFLPRKNNRKSNKVYVSLEKKRLLAVHEAGHIVLAHLFPRFDWHPFSQLLPGGKVHLIVTEIPFVNCLKLMLLFYLNMSRKLQYQCSIPCEDMIDQGYTTFGYMKMQMVVAHGGRCAESVVFGEDITDEGKDDTEKITKVTAISVFFLANPKIFEKLSVKSYISSLH